MTKTAKAKSAAKKSAQTGKARIQSAVSKSKVVKKVNHYFPDWVGQKDAIGYFDETLTLIEKGEIFPLQALFLQGFAGLGKTRLAKKVAEVAAQFGFGFVEIPSSITLPAFLQMWGNLIEGKKVVIFVDECSQITKNPKVANLLKRILETQKSVMPIATDTGHLTSNPFEHWWIFASNEEPKDSALFGPASRTKPLLLLPYTQDETVQIILQMAEKWHFSVHKDAAEYLAGRVMPNGRAISELVENDLIRYSKLIGGKITLDVAKRVVIEQKRYPLGLRQVDVQTLAHLANEQRGLQVSEIAMRCGGEDSKTTGDRIRALAGLRLVITLGNGRKGLTDDGAQYLQKLKEAAAKAKASANGSKPTTKAPSAKVEAKATPAKAAKK